MKKHCVRGELVYHVCFGSGYLASRSFRSQSVEVVLSEAKNRGRRYWGTNVKGQIWIGFTDALDNYIAKRGNGEAQDNPKDAAGETIDFPVDGDFDDWQNPRDGWWYLRYTEGLNDKAWMEERDLNYILRLEREGRLLVAEPNADREIVTEHQFRWEIEQAMQRARAAAEAGVGPEDPPARQPVAEHRPRPAAKPPQPAAALAANLDIPYRDLRLLEVKGSGGFGIVYLATWQGVEVAVKRLHIQAVDDAVFSEFMHEVEIFSQLRHPNIVPFYGVCREPGNYAMVMEYAPQGSLFKHIKGHREAGRQMSWRSRWQLAVGTGAGLCYLHSKEYMHLDLKSLNVLVHADSHAKLTDFGLTKARVATTRATPGLPVGTPAWMAPEIFSIRPIESKQADIYSYGMIMWELASQQEPYKGARVAAIQAHVEREGREDIPPDCPPDFAAIIRRSWAQRREDRPSAKEVTEYLQAHENTIARP